MCQIVRIFSDGTSIEFRTGGFDDWCVYLINTDGEAEAPLDTDYFAKLNELAGKYGVNKVYEDFVLIYDNTSTMVKEDTLNLIDNLLSSYTKEDSLTVEKLFLTLYMTMISEENYPNTRLGRRIKRLGIYEMFFGKKEVDYAANFMRGMDWKEISNLCSSRGF
ncbi:hypothetical protein EHS16_06330 [Streptococcus anginosus]|uniref:DUF7004 family protein n=1 Tax=Streptococcus sp. HMSC36C04 TaxID=1608868 RepID=UPI0008AA1CF6|nr:hypothetical protein [Streptococcus sp. HMSC36C04]OHS91358.1 hypothetical protein HMPREF3249_07995 [Streptococcus sp. HMSC36C04]RRR21407.1 hypothetical protein EHS16_06330 [Streptococcus anginosus]